MNKIMFIFLCVILLTVNPTKNFSQEKSNKTDTTIISEQSNTHVISKANKDVDNGGIFIIMSILILLIVLVTVAYFIDKKRQKIKLEREQSEKLRLEKKKYIDDILNNFENQCIKAKDFFSMVEKTTQEHLDFFDTKDFYNIAIEKKLEIESIYDKQIKLNLSVDSNVEEMIKETEKIKSYLWIYGEKFISFNDRLETYDKIVEMLNPERKEKLLNEMKSIEKECSELVSNFYKFCGHSTQIDYYIKKTKASPEEVMDLYNKLEKYKNNITLETIDNIKNIKDLIYEKLTEYREMLSSIKQIYHKVNGFREDYDKNEVIEEIHKIMDEIKTKWNIAPYSYRNNANSQRILLLQHTVSEFTIYLPKTNNSINDWVSVSNSYFNLLKDLKDMKLDIEYELNRDIYKSTYQQGFSYGIQGTTGSAGMAGSASYMNFPISGSYKSVEDKQ